MLECAFDAVLIIDIFILYLLLWLNSNHLFVSGQDTKDTSINVCSQKLKSIWFCHSTCLLIEETSDPRVGVVQSSWCQDGGIDIRRVRDSIQEWMCSVVAVIHYRESGREPACRCVWPYAGER
jgi:hypothetical protein